MASSTPSPPRMVSAAAPIVAMELPPVTPMWCSTSGVNQAARDPVAVATSSAPPTSSSTSTLPQYAIFVDPIATTKHIVMMRHRCSTTGPSQVAHVVMSALTYSAPLMPSSASMGVLAPTSKPNANPWQNIMSDCLEHEQIGYVVSHHMPVDLIKLCNKGFSTGACNSDKLEDDKPKDIKHTYLFGMVRSFCSIIDISTTNCEQGDKMPKPPWLICAEVSNLWSGKMLLINGFLLEGSPWCREYLEFVQLKTAWPPPVPLKVASKGANLRPSPWPFFFCYEVESKHPKLLLLPMSSVCNTDVPLVHLSFQSQILVLGDLSKESLPQTLRLNSLYVGVRLFTDGDNNYGYLSAMSNEMQRQVLVYDEGSFIIVVQEQTSCKLMINSIACELSKLKVEEYFYSARQMQFILWSSTLETIYIDNCDVYLFSTTMVALSRSWGTNSWLLEGPLYLVKFTDATCGQVLELVLKNPQGISALTSQQHVNSVWLKTLVSLQQQNGHLHWPSRIVVFLLSEIQLVIYLNDGDCWSSWLFARCLKIDRETTCFLYVFKQQILKQELEFEQYMCHLKPIFSARRDGKFAHNIQLPWDPGGDQIFADECEPLVFLENLEVGQFLPYFAKKRRRVVDYKQSGLYSGYFCSTAQGSSTKQLKHVTPTCLGSEASNCKVSQLQLKAVKLLAVSKQAFLSDIMNNTIALQAVGGEQITLNILQMPWDPGEILQQRLGDKPCFKGERMSGTYGGHCRLGRFGCMGWTWAAREEAGLAEGQTRKATLLYKTITTITREGVDDQELNRETGGGELRLEASSARSLPYLFPLLPVSPCTQHPEPSRTFQILVIRYSLFDW